VWYNKKMKKAIQSVVWKEGKHYVARALNVEVSSFGASRREALKNLREALELYFEDAPASGTARIERPELVTI